MKDVPPQTLSPADANRGERKLGSDTHGRVREACDKRGSTIQPKTNHEKDDREARDSYPEALLT